MKIVVIGGHLSPALSVLPHLKEHEILYLGRKYTFEADKTLSLEYRVISSLGVNFKNITTGRLQRNFSLQTILSLLKFPIGLVQSFLILKNFKPDVVLGFGGYVQIPIVFTAFVLRIPVFIHEQSLKAGLANKIASVFASKILISWESSQEFFSSKKTVLTGIPLRSEIIQSSRPKDDRPLAEKLNESLIYITGGTSGSHAINILVERNLKELLQIAKIFHQTGDAKEFGDFERLSEVREKLSEELKKRYMIMKFVDSKDVAKILQSAGLIISRSGMSTISEIIFFEKPALLIPLPLGNEQRDNANFLKNLGLAEVIDQNISNSEFVSKVKFMIYNLKNYKLLRNLLILNANQRIIEELSNVV